MNRHLIESVNDQVTVSDDWRASLVEHVLLVGLICLFCTASLTVLGDGVSGNVNQSATQVFNATGGSGG
jgi:Flp pilus assembly pilin Flp